MFFIAKELRQALAPLKAQLDRIQQLLEQMKSQETKDMATQAQAMADLTTAVANDTTVSGSIITLLNGVAAQLAAALAANNPAAIEALVTQLNANAAAMAAAVTANTPAAPPATT